MSMQIKNIILYGANNKKRMLSFNLGKVNILTGESKTGKSAIIDIVEYCLGSDKCRIPEGIIRENVLWFALIIQFPSGQAFIARRNPSLLNVGSTGKIYFEQADEIEIPDVSKLIENSSIDALKTYLSNKLYITPNVHITPENQSRPDIEGNFRHALIYCFQQQDEIASRKFIFHNQSDTFVNLAIKDTLPYFLGAIPENNLKLEQELAELKKELRKLEKEYNEALNIKEEGVSKAFSLINEAQELGLLTLNKKPDHLEDAIILLRGLNDLELNDDDVLFDNSQSIFLQDELKNLKEKLQGLNEEINAVEIFESEVDSYSKENKLHQLRLESINLYEEKKYNPNQCPLCSQELKVSVPTIKLMHDSLEKLKNNLEVTTKERPRLREYINELKKQKIEIQNKIRENKQAITAIYKEQEATKKFKELNIRKGHVIGRISLFLESVDLTDDFSELKSNIDSRKFRILELEQKLNPEEKTEKLNSILNIINVHMSEWAKRLDLEYGDAPIRFDLKKATLFVDKEEKSIPLQNIGSGENWVGYHLLIHLALHKHFAKNHRPVPSFLFLDQPSQVYYPPDQDSNLKGELKIDSDRQAVSNMYNLIFDVVETLSPKLQVIITDHADLKEDKFQKSVIDDKWRNGIKLIPIDWYKITTSPANKIIP